jgi:aryl-alcohol dehydrogenase-like predicted oxidoreductase
VRFIGLSNESAWGTMTFLKEAEARGLPRVQSVQNAYHLLNRTFETALAEVALREQVGLLAYSPLAQGFSRASIWTARVLPAPASLSSIASSATRSPDRKRRSATMWRSPAKPASIPAVMAIAFVASRPFVASAIIGATSMAQLKTAIDAGETVLSPDILAPSTPSTR